MGLKQSFWNENAEGKPRKLSRLKQDKFVDIAFFRKPLHTTQRGEIQRGSKTDGGGGGVEPSQRLQKGWYSFIILNPWCIVSFGCSRSGHPVAACGPFILSYVHFLQAISFPGHVLYSLSLRAGHACSSSRLCPPCSHNISRIFSFLPNL